MSENILRLARAIDFAARKHSEQRRKGSKAEPYVNHLAEVARLVAEATGGEDPDLVVAALLHDKIEDVGVTYEELAHEFGTNVADLVREVTDDNSLPKEERKRLQVVTAPHKSVRARLLKIADKTSNLSALLGSPPAGWSLERKQQYFEWATAVVDGCRGINSGLEAHFDALLARKDELGVQAKIQGGP